MFRETKKTWLKVENKSFQAVLTNDQCCRFPQDDPNQAELQPANLTVLKGNKDFQEHCAAYHRASKTSCNLPRTYGQLLTCHFRLHARLTHTCCHSRS